MEEVFTYFVFGEKWNGDEKLQLFFFATWVPYEKGVVGRYLPTFLLIIIYQTK